MSLKSTPDQIEIEFESVRKGKNPEIASDIEAIVVLSGESGDFELETELHDTEERTRYATKIFKKISRLGGSPVLIVDGTDSQNLMMEKMARKAGILSVTQIINPPVPIASTLTQFEGLQKLKFRKLVLITEGYHAPRVLRYAKQYLSNNIKFQLFVIHRNFDKKMQAEEIKKIKTYFPN
jgi:hypothetical protein